MPLATGGRIDHTATLLSDGKLLVAGGDDSGGGFPVATAEVYNLANNMWTAAGPLNTARSLHTATLLLNGKVMVAGGQGTAVYLDTAELFDPADGPNGTWRTSVNRMNVARRSHTATLLPNGKVLVAGGYFNGTYLQSAELYDPTTDTWTAVATPNFGRALHTGTLLPSGKVLIAAGYGDNGYLNHAEVFDPANGPIGTWTPTQNSMSTARYSHTATLLPDGKVLVAAGLGANGLQTESAEVYNPANNMWTATMPVNIPRYGHTATLLPNGKVLVAGGSNIIGDDGGAVMPAELYDAVTGMWAVTGQLTSGHHGHTATLLPNGRVLVVAGYGDGGTSGTTPNAEIYDP